MHDFSNLSGFLLYKREIKSIIELLISTISATLGGFIMYIKLRQKNQA